MFPFSSGLHSPCTEVEVIKPEQAGVVIIADHDGVFVDEVVSN